MLKSQTARGLSVTPLLYLLGRKEQDFNHSAIRIADILLLVYYGISGRFLYILSEISRVQGT